MEARGRKEDMQVGKRKERKKGGRRKKKKKEATAFLSLCKEPSFLIRLSPWKRNLSVGGGRGVKKTDEEDREERKTRRSLPGKRRNLLASRPTNKRRKE